MKKAVTYTYTYKHEGVRLPFGEGARPSDWIRSAGNLGEYPRILVRRGTGGVWKWIVVIPGYEPERPVVEARLEVTPSTGSERRSERR